jgi:hypothetical protein
LPLDGSVSQEITAQVDPGRYDEIEFDIHKPDDDNQRDLDFIALNPNFADISIRVTGTYNGLGFVFTSDLNEEQASIEGFRDDDGDGVRHGDDDDELDD